MDPVTIENLLSMSTEFGLTGTRMEADEIFARTAWEQVTSAAERYNEPRRFTAFIGFEWSSSGSTRADAHGGNLHRVVIFKDGAAKANRVRPFSAKDCPDPEDLWAYMAGYERDIGGEVLAIPHNGNLSNGQLFALENFAGEVLTKEYAQTRSRWEPLYETTQIKGDTESHPFLSPTDEFADYETWSSWRGAVLPSGRNWDAREKIVKEGEYARSALKRGLSLQARLGVNPFKFGLVGGSDAHTGLAGSVDERNFWGKTPPTEPGSGRALPDELTVIIPMSLARARDQKLNSDSYTTLARSWQMASSGLAAVWATENTREALFAAMKRKETYATTGPRMTVRFFGGWEFTADDAFKHDLAAIGYRKGVPMGGDLTRPRVRQAPSFLIRAVKDPDGANLDRVQVIKSWLDKSGEAREKIYDVAVSDGRKQGKDGKVPPVGSTVNVEDATYTNTIGDPELAVVWTDPDFDPNAFAVYYARVLEIPTPRWTAHDKKFFGVKNVSPDVPMVTQERAYASPIWYTP